MRHSLNTPQSRSSFPVPLRLSSSKSHGKEILGTVGNNDVQPDYELPVEPNTTALKALAAAWKSQLSADAMSDLLRGGYFAQEVGTRQARWRWCPYSSDSPT